MDIGTKLRDYVKQRRFKLECDRERVASGNARRSISAAIAELMFIEEHLNEIDPIGKTRYTNVVSKQTKIYEEDL